ncbi:transcription elongation factor Spt5 [Desulfurococcus mucosus]|uniref:Transcription elongation factor Spt5 n=1 Tax=Desulfurococcus mucosus (strain ATCC 35584 / DSM 2162 / JCM 9187 / O7/1) TaxID=765177 RepID=E8RAA7_DESM0|nr:LSU ribosomal protein L24A [Desulfurococcus mucosus DSM 2162]
MEDQQSSGEEQARIYAVKTTVGRELDVAFIISMRVEEKKAKGEETSVRSIIIPPDIKGYVFLEVEKLSELYRVVSDIRYVKAGRPMKIAYEELEKLLKPKPVIEELDVGDIVEITRGPFKGMRAKITGVDRNKNMLTVNILEATFTIPITIPGDYVKKMSKGA